MKLKIEKTFFGKNDFSIGNVFYKENKKNGLLLKSKNRFPRGFVSPRPNFSR